MTAKKNFKRLVRARARKTGESYAAALQHFQHRSAEDQPVKTPALRRIEKPEYGFALEVPVEWVDEPPDLKNSPWEAARAFASYPDGARRGFIVFRNPAGPGADPEAAARGAQNFLSRNGFSNFALSDAVIAGRPAVRLDFDRPSVAPRVWAVRHYFLVVENRTFCVSFGTSEPSEDGPLVERLAASFELIGDLAKAKATPRMAHTPLVIERPEHGFALQLPPNWFERPPNPESNPWEVGRFSERGDARHSCAVTRRPRPDRTARELAEEQQKTLEASGFTNVRLSDVVLAGKPAVRLDGEQRDAGRVWIHRSYHLVADGIAFAVQLGTAVPGEDATLFESIADTFRLVPSS